MRQPENSMFGVDGSMKGAKFGTSLNILVPPKSDGWPLAFYMYVNLCKEEALTLPINKFLKI